MMDDNGQMVNTRGKRFSMQQKVTSKKYKQS